VLFRSQLASLFEHLQRTTTAGSETTSDDEAIGYLQYRYAEAARVRVIAELSTADEDTVRRFSSRLDQLADRDAEFAAVRESLARRFPDLRTCVRSVVIRG